MSPAHNDIMNDIIVAKVLSIDILSDVMYDYNHPSNPSTQYFWEENHHAEAEGTI